MRWPSCCRARRWPRSPGSPGARYSGSCSGGGPPSGPALLADRPAALLVLAFLQGALSFALGSTLITRILYEAAAAPTMAGSYATAAFNVGAATGPLIAASTLGTTAGNLGPLWASGLLVAVALLVAFPLRSVITARRKAEALR